ncbi:signal peptide peptidase-like 2A [Tetranychus urticae]|uniref:PA domain-containing protein n=1 Tax=Tetranychus urticae TaxID=32264 RepID=T1JX93_TETUR|nr:signal peptide peptidase-like 2A [Tetranychus urticae]
MILSTLPQPTYCNPVFGLLLVLFVSQTLCLPGSYFNSSSLNDTSVNRTISSTFKYLLRSPRSPSDSSSSYSYTTAPEEGLPVSLGLLVATGRTNGSGITYCIAHYNSREIADGPDKAQFFNLIKADDINFCSPPPKSQNGLSDAGSYILTNFNNKCTLIEQAVNVQDYYKDCKGIIISLPNDVNVYKLFVKRNITDPKFIIALIGEDSTADMLNRYQNQVRAMVYQPKDSNDEERGIFESSLVGIWLIAVFTVAIGGYSSGILRYELFLTRQLHENEAALEESEEEGSNDQERKKKKKTKLDDAVLDVTPTTVVFFVIYMCAVLLILYFFYSYLIFIMIIFFVVFCTISIYSLIMGLSVNYVAPRLNTKWSKYGWRIGVTLVSLIAPVTWFFIRKTNQAWSLQNALAIIFCIHILQNLRFPNFRITSFLLTLLFAYDIFFVFLTPFLTSDGESIMVKVATGGTSSEISYSFGIKSISESLPVVFQWPRSLSSTLFSDKCYQGRVFWTSKLGFGDVLVPGFLVSYCHALDLFQKTPYRLYFTVECIFYGLGLIVTFIALNLMNQAQPALLYLVPATLVPPLVIAWFRNEINILWYGPEPAAIEARLRERAALANNIENGPAPNNVSANQEETASSNNPKESLVTNQLNEGTNTQENKSS